MKILIVGLGRMGYSLAEQLDREGHAVYAIDHDPVCVERARVRLDIMAIKGSGCSLNDLRELGVTDADLAIAASGWDEVNVVSCLVARELGVKRCIARIESTELADNLREMPASSLGVDEFVNPRHETVNRLIDIIKTPGTTMTAEFDEGRVQLRGLRVEKDSQLTGMPLMALKALFVEHFLVPAVLRGEDLIVPKGDFTIQTGDVIYLILRTEMFEPFLDLFEFPNKQAKRVFVYGARGIGLDLCREIEKEIPDVILLDEDWDLRKQASSVLHKTSIIDGSPRDQNLMTDLKISTGDYFIGASESEEANFSSALIARRLGVRNTVMLTDHPSHVELFDTLPLDAVISPAVVSVGAILKAVRSGNVLSMFNIAGGRGEAIEVAAQEGSKAVGKKLMDVSFPEGVMVAAVVNENGFSIASGNTVIKEQDKVILITLRESINEALELFGK